MNGKTIGLVVSLLVAPAVFLGLTVKDASALSGYTLELWPWTWANTATLLCLDSNTDGDVYTVYCHGDANVFWFNAPASVGYQIQDITTARCLYGNDKGEVDTQPCFGGVYQQWTLTNLGIYGYEIKNVGTGFCLDSNSNGNVYALGCNGGNFQRWH